MKVGLIITKPLDYLTKEFLCDFIENNKEYHLCLVRNAKSCNELYDFLDKSAKAESINISVVSIKYKSLSPIKAAKRYLQSRNDIENIIVINKSNMTIIQNLV